MKLFDRSVRCFRRIRGAGFAVFFVACLVASPFTLVAQVPLAPGSSPFGVGGSPRLASYQTDLLSSRTFADVAWSEIEPSQDRFNFAATDRLLTSLRQAGLEPMLKVGTCGLTASGKPFWGTLPPPPGSEPPPNACTAMPPRSWSDFADFITRLVQRYKTAGAAGIPVRYFAMNNEVNASGQWPGPPGSRRCIIDERTGATDCPVFDDYFKLLRRATSAAHNANPNAVVLDGALASRVYGLAIARDKYQDGGKTDAALSEAVAFYNKFYALRYSSHAAAGVFYVDPKPASTLRSRFESRIFAPYDPDRNPDLGVPVGDRFYYIAKHMFDDPGAFDAFQLHFYDNWSLTGEVLDWIHKQMDQRWGVGHRKPILCWECGSHWPMVDPDGDGWANYFNYDVNDNASWVAKRFILGLSRGVQQLIHLGLSWEKRPEAAELFRSPPLICSEGSRFEPQLCGGVVDRTRLTPAGKVFRKLAGTLVGTTSVTPVTIYGTGVQGFRFGLSSGGSVVTLWSLTGDQRVDLRRLGSLRSISDQYGSTKPLTGAASFQLDETVTYVTIR